MTNEVQFYEDKDGLWRWRCQRRNGRIIADSGEGYDSERNARRGFRTAVMSMFMAYAMVMPSCRKK